MNTELLKRTAVNLSEYTDDHSESSRQDRILDFDDNLSESISDAIDTGSLESFDRLSLLSDSVPEHIESDQVSKLSLPLLLPADSDPTLCFQTLVDQLTTLSEVEIQSYDETGSSPCRPSTSTTLVIQTSPAKTNFESSFYLGQNDAKDFTLEFECDSSEALRDFDACDDTLCDLESRDPVDLDVTEDDLLCDENVCDEMTDIADQTSVIPNTGLSKCDAHRCVASAPVTPYGDDMKKKNKNPSPSLSLLEKSTSWISSLSSGPKKVKKSFRAHTKKSLTSLFEAVASSASMNNNNAFNISHDASSQSLKLNLSNTLPVNFGQKQKRRSTVQEKLNRVPIPTIHMNDSSRSASSLSLTELNVTNGSQPSLGTSFRVGRKSKKLSPSTHPSGYQTIDSHRLPTSKHSRSSLEDKKLLQCVKQFNLDPKKGMELLEFHGFLDSNDHEKVANFLFSEGRLSKKQIGAYIGDHHEFNKLVLTAFVGQHKFMDLILVQALRQFLWSFRLPGEAMQIDRIMEAFASHYCDQNPELFDETDTCYILSFSIIMLNTALHNPNVRQKITLEQFVTQNRGINSGKDLPKEILEKIYRNIKDEPFEIPNESYDDLMYTFFSPEKEGWLLKQGGNWKSWKRRWFVLSDRCLYYFQHTAENVPKGIIPLENVKVRAVTAEDQKFCFELYSESNSVIKGCKTDSKGTVVQGRHKTYRMCASSNEEREAWIKTISESIKEHPFYDHITAKKAALRRKSLKHMQQHDIPTPTTPIVSHMHSNSSSEPTPISCCAQT